MAGKQFKAQVMLMATVLMDGGRARPGQSRPGARVHCVHTTSTGCGLSGMEWSGTEGWGGEVRVYTYYKKVGYL